MGMTKKIEIDGKEVLFKDSAAIPRIYRIKFISCTLQYGEDRGTLKEDWLRFPQR